MPILKRRTDIPGYEEVYDVLLATDPPVQACIAIHDTTAGPALGGCRIRKYRDANEMRADALRLAEAMTLKSAAAGLPLGGGKMVVDADPSAKTPELLAEIARAVDTLGGRYITAEDMGTGREDIRYMSRYTRHVAWREGAGDPSPATSFGVLVAMDAWSVWRRGAPVGSDDRVAIQGAGNVGSKLATMLARRGCSVVITDMDMPRARHTAREVHGEAVTPEHIFSVECTIFAPAAAGGVLDARVWRRLKCAAVCGPANNQLPAPGVLKLARERGIDYVPDFVVNAGGVCHAWLEMDPRIGHYDVAAHVLGIGGRVRAILDESERTGLSTHEIAVRMAMERVNRLRAGGSAVERGEEA